MNESPDSILSERILSKLQASNALKNETLEDLKKQIKSGTLKSEDWILLLEKDIEKLKEKQNGK